jgi:hypothetical protein
MFLIFQIEMLSFSSIFRDYILCKHLVIFSSIGLPDLNHRFFVPLHLMFRFTLYIWCAILHWCYWYSSLFAFLTVPWIMTSPSVWLKSAPLIADGLSVPNQNFHSIVIVVPLHVSKSSRVLKKLTNYSAPGESLTFLDLVIRRFLRLSGTSISIFVDIARSSSIFPCPQFLPRPSRSFPDRFFGIFLLCPAFFHRFRTSHLLGSVDLQGVYWVPGPPHFPWLKEMLLSMCNSVDSKLSPSCGCISLTAISTSEKLELTCSPGSPWLCSLSPPKFRPQCDLTGMPPCCVDNWKGRSYMEQDSGNRADVQVCGTDSHHVLIDCFQFYGRGASSKWKA